MTHGRGADYVIVTVGSLSAMQQAYQYSAPHGLTVIVGLPPCGGTITIPAMLPAERMITSSNMGSTKLSVEVPKLVELYTAGKLMLDELITARFPLSKINEAIEAVEKGQALRNVIMFDTTSKSRTKRSK